MKWINLFDHFLQKAHKHALNSHVTVKNFSLIHISFCGLLLSLDVNAEDTHQIPQNTTIETTAIANNHLDDKHYRQALFYYFAGDNASALRQIALNKQQKQSYPQKSQLFEAGLQVNLGLHNQASETLTQLVNTEGQTHSSTEHQDERSATSPRELMVVALLQLSEHQINQGNTHLAQQTLSKISNLPNQYSHQYQILQQLSHWPSRPSPMLAANASVEQHNVDDSQHTMTLDVAYIKINQALAFMANQQFSDAEPILISINQQQWLQQPPSFWQNLFEATSESSNTATPMNDQLQAIVDYAQLLLAQLYIEKNAYTDAFDILSNFPEHSPYTESALFLFAYANQKIGNHAQAANLYALIQQGYPYSELAWQSNNLLASQLVQQNKLSQAFTRLEVAETFYQQKLTELSLFENQYQQSQTLLDFMPEAHNNAISIDNQTSKHNQHFLSQHPIDLQRLAPYQSQSPWLQIALTEPKLKAQYAQLQQVQQLSQAIAVQLQQVDWIEHAIELNNVRQQDVLVKQQQTPYSQLIEELAVEIDRLGKALNDAEHHQSAQVFADEQQMQWLMRIKRSESLIESIASHRNTTQLKARLERVKGVMSWELSQSYPQRLWQHKKQHKQLTLALEQLKAQQQQFAEQAQQGGNLSVYSQQLVLSRQAHQQQVDRLLKLDKQLTASVRALVTTFIGEKRDVLQQHLLSTRHHMAQILEAQSVISVQQEAL
ncbi:tol-pal system YbgF family protein [Shewanella maritima]|uniref:tetratricopeptide repeat protein n=1 Tax=Shewanella maritima TaxID=2520507 RepID=UPI0037363820